MIYEYIDITTHPNLKTKDGEGVEISGIHYDVNNSSMTNKNIKGCTWHEDKKNLFVDMDGELSAGDKTILDGIVNNNT